MYHLKQRYLLLILVVVSTSVYFNSLNSEVFLVDDMPIIEEFIQNDYTLYDMIRLDKGRSYKVFYDASYRPLFGLSLFLDFSLWFDGVRGYHLTNLLFHVLNVVLLFFLSRKIWGERSDVVQISFIAALIFSVHPIHTESVDWISGRLDPMATLFTGLSLLVYLSWKEIKSLYYPVFASLFFLLGLLSREIAFVLIPILVIYELLSLLYKNKEKDFSGIYKTALIVPLLLVLLIVFNMLQHQFASNYQSRPRFGLLENYLRETGCFQILYENMAYLGYYLFKLFFPAPLNYSTTKIYLPFYFAFSIVSVPALVNLARRERVLLFLLGASILSILPNLPAQFFSRVVVAERYLYLPSLFFCTGAGFFISKFLGLPSPEKGGSTSGRYSFNLFVVVSLFVLMVSLTVERNHQWNNNYQFWKNAVKKSPDSPEVLLKYAGVLGMNYVSFRSDDAHKELLKRAPLIKRTELLPGNGYEMVEKAVEKAGRLGDRGGYLVLAIMGKADRDPVKVMSYLDLLDSESLDTDALLTYSMLLVYLSKNIGEDKAGEEKLVLNAIKYLKKYIAFRKRDDANTLKIARLYMRISRYKEAGETLDELLNAGDLSPIQKKAAIRLAKKIEDANI